MMLTFSYWKERAIPKGKKKQIQKKPKYKAFYNSN